MNHLLKIIKEEYQKFISEYYNNNTYFKKEDELKQQIFDDFLFHNNFDFTKHIPWKVIPFARL